MKPSLYLLALIASLFACKAANNPGNQNGPQGDVMRDLRARKVLIDKDLYTSTTEAIPIDTAYLIKDTLHIFTKKIVGCNTQNFSLVWNGNMAKSLPPLVNVKLLHVAELSCQAKYKFHLTYNLSPMRYADDTLSAKTMNIRIGGWKEMLKYEF